MDSAALTALQTSLISFKDNALSLLLWIIPIAGVILITTTLVGFGISFFRRFLGLSATGMMSSDFIYPGREMTEDEQFGTDVYGNDVYGLEDHFNYKEWQENHQL